MRNEEVTLMLIRGLIASMSQREQEQVNGVADQLRTLIIQHGDAGVIAMTLVAGEEAAKK